MEESWSRVTSWLARYAPGSYRALDPPATSQQIEQAQSRLHVPLPEALVTLLSMTNGSAFTPDAELQFGSRFLPGGYSLLPVADIPGRIEMLNGIVEEDMLGWWWHPQWVLFAEHVAADALVVDQREGPSQGRVGEFRHDHRTDFELSSSLTDYVSSIADALEQRQDFGCWRPLVVDRRLDWDFVAGS